MGVFIRCVCAYNSESNPRHTIMAACSVFGGKQVVSGLTHSQALLVDSDPHVDIDTTERCKHKQTGNRVAALNLNSILITDCFFHYSFDF